MDSSFICVLRAGRQRLRYDSLMHDTWAEDLTARACDSMILEDLAHSFKKSISQFFLIVF